ncbi:MAG: hypothetical protein JYX80_13535 [Candidatus Scalindua sediminis]|nr:hypothetical protein [Candidatus Scalindua sediminis]
MSSIPSSLRKRLVKNYSTLKNQALEDRHDTIGHQAGKLAEVLLRILQNILTGANTPLSKGLTNFKGECERLEQTPKTAGPEGLRVLMPRALLFLYTLRNKRDFGHAGGEVVANEIDALTAMRVADWCMCELIRVCHSLPLEDAQLLCNAIAERKLAALWNVLGRKRVLYTSLSYRDQTLLLLYSDIETGIPTEDLFEWTEHSNRSNYRRDILAKLHSGRLIEWDKKTEMAIISPSGIDEVENNILPKERKKKKKGAKSAYGLTGQA